VWTCSTSYLKNQFPNTSAIQEQGQQNYALGDANTLVWGSFVNGTETIVTASYSNGEGNRTYQINFKCNKLADNDGKGAPTFLNETTPNNFLFEWETSYACTSTPAHDCTVFYQQLTFDLSPLRNESSDFKITSDDDGTFFINICGPLLDQDVCGGGPNSEDNAVACQNNQNQQRVLGTADSVYFNYNGTAGSITATYYGGYQGSTLVYNIQCDQNTTGPTFFNKVNNAYIFVWKSPVACVANSTSSLGRKQH